MMFLRGELMRITFDVGRVTVQEYNNKLLYSHISNKHIDSTTVKHN